jgi:hypothetical protein
MTGENPQIVAGGVTYYSLIDEELFFDWLDRMPFVKEYHGVVRDLFIIFNRLPTKGDLVEIIAFCMRYRIEMTQLAKFVNDENREWLTTAWGEEIFGSRPSNES